MELLMCSYVMVGLASLYLFNKFLNCFFEYRVIPDFWKFFFWGVSIYWVSDAVLPLMEMYLRTQSFDIFYAIIQPIGPALALYAVYKIEEEARNV